MLNHRNSNIIIILLMILAAFIEFIDAITRRVLIKIIGDYESDQIKVRLRSIEIVTSSLLTLLNYSLLNTKINRHHFVTLIVIVVCLIIAVIFEFIFIKDYIHIPKDLI